MEDNACGGEKKSIIEPETSITIPTKPATSIIIPFKGKNQKSIALAHNPVIYTKTKHINIQHHYIYNEVAMQKIKLLYIQISKMIANGLKKLLINIKFHEFFTQIKMIQERQNIAE